MIDAHRLASRLFRVRYLETDPVSELLALFGSFQNARLVHFPCTTGIVLFMIVHVSLTLLVSPALVAMFNGGLRHQPASARSGIRSVFRLRLLTATKLGFKNAKLVTAVEVTDDFPSKASTDSRDDKPESILGRSINPPLLRTLVHQPVARASGERVPSPRAVGGAHHDDAAIIIGGEFPNLGG